MATLSRWIQVSLGASLVVAVAGCAPLPTPPQPSPQPRPTSTVELSVEGIVREQLAAAALPKPSRVFPWGERRRQLGTYGGRQVELAYICFGDVCPDNGGYYVRYVGIETKDECEALGGEPILGTGWGVVYGGCGVRVGASE